MLGAFRVSILFGLSVIAEWPAASIAQQTFESFNTVDFFYAQDPQRFKKLWQDAQSQTVRIAVLGDSQETSPTSHGFQYIPLLNYEMWRRFGNSPETPVVGCFFFGGGGRPPGNWLLSGKCENPAAAVTRLASNQILPHTQDNRISVGHPAISRRRGKILHWC